MLASAQGPKGEYCHDRVNTQYELDVKRKYCMQTTCELEDGTVMTCDAAAKAKPPKILSYRQPLWWPWAKRSIVIRPDFTCNRSCASSMTLQKREQAIETAIEAWNRAQLPGQSTPCTDVSISLGPPPSSRASNLYKDAKESQSYDNTLIFREDGPETKWEENTAVDDRPRCEVLALTVVRFIPDTGQILDADIDFNGLGECGHIWSDREARPEHNLTLVAAHEFGHLLGFAHNTSTCSLMYPSVGADCDEGTGPSNSAPLYPDIDTLGVCEAYQKGAPTPWAPQDLVYGGLEGQSLLGSCQMGQAHSGSASAIMSVVCLMATVAIRRRNRRQSNR